MRLAVSTIRGLTQSGRLRSRRFGRQVRVSKAALLAFLDESGR
jgi:excisionase family DNA binding protein